ncbi:MAG: riboflavin biosynthesis protein RibF [Acidobacteria bacterium]|nr:riboflavin biosynthesis protein RibF [Acidobacteriota bacterium]
MPFQVLHSPEDYSRALQGRSVLTIGNFDGIHLAHQRILLSVVGRAKERRMTMGSESAITAGAITFDPHPLKFLRPAEAPRLLQTTSQRLAAMETFGLDAVLVLPFSEMLAKIPAEEFVTRILVEQLRVAVVLVGQNFRFGHRHSGDVALLSRLGIEHGFSVEFVPPVRFRGKMVSSTLVRRAIQDGRVAYASRLLGRPFELTGTVQTGAARGRQIGFPTLNLKWEQEILPRPGVYVTETSVGGRPFKSVSNVGTRPTFDGQHLSVESHRDSGTKFSANTS